MENELQYGRPVAAKNIAREKAAFLERLKSPSNPDSFKRYPGSPLRYAGGKSLAAGHIVKLLPDTLKRVVSPFFGGGSVETAIANELGVPVAGYDIFDILVNYWQEQIREPEALAARLAAFTPDRGAYLRVREILRRHWKGEAALDGPDLAAAYYFNHNFSYGPHFLGSPSSVYLRPKPFAAALKKVRGFRAPNLTVFCESFETSIPRHCGDFLYCDPPYYLGGGSEVYTGMYPNRAFPVFHNGFGHEKLRDLLKAHKGGFILSCLKTNRRFLGFEINEQYFDAANRRIEAFRDALKR